MSLSPIADTSAHTHHRPFEHDGDATFLRAAEAWICTFRWLPCVRLTCVVPLPKRRFAPRSMVRTRMIASSAPTRRCDFAKNLAATLRSVDCVSPDPRGFFCDKSDWTQERTLHSPTSCLMRQFYCRGRFFLRVSSGPFLRGFPCPCDPLPDRPPSGVESSAF